MPEEDTINMGSTDDNALDGAAKIAGEILRYEPANNQEERDLLLAKMIFDCENRISDLEIKINAAKFKLRKLDLEREVHSALISGLSEEQAYLWQYNFSEDFYQMERNELDELISDEVYEESWLEAARKLIKTEKYKSVPSEFFRNYHFDYDNNESPQECCGCCDDEIPF